MNNKTFAAISMFIILAVLLFYLYINLSVSYSTVYVDPQISDIAVSQDLAISINISNVADLYGWEVRLSWNTTILEAVDVTEGPFLKGGGNTYFSYSANATSGVIIADCALLANLTGVSGDGSLLTIQFHAKETGDCVLNIFEAILLDSSEESITSRPVNGQVNVFNTSTIL